MNLNVVIVGAGGHAKVCIDVLRSLEYYIHSCIGNDITVKTCNGVTVYHGDDALWHAVKDGICGAFVAIGDNARRSALLQRLETRGCRVVTVVSPHATVSPSARIGHGSIVMPGAVVNSDAVIGAGVIVNTGAIVEHDATVGDYAHLAPGSIITGGVGVGTLAIVGAGATVLPRVMIGNSAVVGAGAVVTRTVPPSTTVAGVPARCSKT